MNGCDVPVFGAALCHGPWLAGGAALAVTPGALWLLGLVLERRWIGHQDTFVAVLLGDPLLAVAVALGVWRVHGAAATGAAAPPYALAFTGICFAFGLWQWATELRGGFFTRAQALAPTKVWHQLAIYPLLGYWLWTSVIGALTARGSSASGIAAEALMVVCVLVWVATNGYDHRHPKLGHPPYEWRRLRPQRGPWPAASTTLRAFRAAVRPPAPPAGGELLGQLLRERVEA